MAKTRDGESEGEHDGPVGVAIPGALSPSDREAWMLMSPRSRQKAATRLGVAERWREVRDAGGPTLVGEAGMLAAEAGISVKRFYEIAADWRERRTLAVLGIRVPVPGGMPARPPAGRRHSASIEGIRAALAEDPGLRTEDLIRRLRSGDGAHGASRASLLRWIADARRGVGPSGPFGEGLVLDFGALDVSDEEGRPLAACGLLDEGTGIALGWSVVFVTAVQHGYVAAASDAARRLSHLRLGTLPAARALRDVRVWLDGAPDQRPLVDLLGRLGRAEVRFGAAGVSRVVRPLTRHLSGRVAWMRILPPDASRRGPVQVARTSEVAALVDEAFEERNREILRVATGVPEGGGQREARRSLAGLLTAPVSRVAPQAPRARTAPGRPHPGRERER